MKREVIDFYAMNKTPLEHMVAAGVHRKNLTSASITSAAEALYEEIQGGLVIPPVRIAWEIFSRAKALKGIVEKAELDKTIDLENKHSALQESHDELSAAMESLQKKLEAAEREIETKSALIDQYVKQLTWYHQPWWKTIFRRNPHG